MKNDITLTITSHDGNYYCPLILDGAKWTIQRRSTPSKFEFEIMKDSNFIIEEGQEVKVRWKDTNFFLGYIFKYSFTKDDTISITCYDQLRYLKNKDTYVFANKTATQIIKSIAGDFNMKCGNIASTSYPLPNYPCDNQSLYDMIEGALDETLTFSKQLYIFYDDFGRLMLKSLEDMKVNDFIITVYNASDFSFSSSIDDKTYNKIKLYSNNEEKGERDIYIEFDSNNQKKWGVLQYYDEVKKGENGKIKAQTLLKLYNSPTRSLSVSDVEGNIKVRAGSRILVKLDLGNNIKLCNYMLVESCTHTFTDNDHRMDLDLVGGKLNG
jgi:hypothetical protein